MKDWEQEEWWKDKLHLTGAELADEYEGAERTWRERKNRAIKGDYLSGVSFTINYLSRGKTDKELDAAGIELAEVKKIPDYELFTTRNTHGEKVYLLLPEIQEVELQPKIWTHRWQADGQPYIWVKMPKKKWDKIKIVPLADVHYGSVAHLDTKFREYINYISENDNVFAVILGDLLENSHGDSNNGVSHYEQNVRPKSQVEQMCELLSPIAHKILWAIPGNHEDRSRTRDYDPLERICEKLEIPYNYMPVYADVMWNDYIFTFYTSHGRSGAMTKGGKMNAAIKPQHMQEHVMFTISGHVHDALMNPTIKICRDRVNFRLEQKKQYVVVCPSFMDYFTSYAPKAGYDPGSYGTINCDLYKNGDYHASG